MRKIKFVSMVMAGIFLSVCCISGNYPVEITAHAAGSGTETGSTVQGAETENTYNIEGETAQLSSTGTGLSKSSLIKIIENHLTDSKYDSFNLNQTAYVDMDNDGNCELVALYSDMNKDGIASHSSVWFCSSDGKECEEINDGANGLDYRYLSVLDAGNEKHIAFNQHISMGTSRSCQVYRYADKKIEQIVSMIPTMNSDEAGNIFCSFEDYGERKGTDGTMTGHTWTQTYVYWDENQNKYKEYGAVELNDTQFRNIENGYKVISAIENDINQTDTYKDYDHLNYKFYFRANRIVQIQCDVYQTDGSIYYGYYETTYKYGALNSKETLIN